MMKTLNKTKVIALISMISIGVSAIQTHAANASVFDWFSSPAITSASFNANSIYISTDQANSEAKNDTDQTLIGSDSLVSKNSPSDLKNQIIANFSGKTITVPATAYSSTPDQTDGDPFITAWGTYVHDGIIAANFLPLGTKVTIPDVFGDKIFTVEDRMNKRYTNRIDVWFTTREGAKQFGIHNVKLQVID